MAYERTEHQVLSQQGATRRAAENDDRHPLVDRMDALRDLDRIVDVGSEQYSIDGLKLRSSTPRETARCRRKTRYGEASDRFLEM